MIPGTVSEQVERSLTLKRFRDKLGKGCGRGKGDGIRSVFLKTQIPGTTLVV